MNPSNNDILSAHSPNTWTRAEHLLPGYLKKNLAASDQVWMEDWIAQTNNAGQAVADALASEMDWVRNAMNEAQGQGSTFNLEQGWQKLQASVQSEPVVLAATEAATSPIPMVSLSMRLQQWFAKLLRMQTDRALSWWQKPAFGALASAMIVGQMGFLAATVKQVHTLTTDAAMVIPASGASRPAQGAVFKVVFKAKATTADIMDALNQVQGRIVGGPGALGLWEIEVPIALQEVAMKKLTQAKAVESATQE